jgi:hypothetical protein
MWATACSLVAADTYFTHCTWHWYNKQVMRCHMFTEHLGTLLIWHDGFLAAIGMLVQAAAARSWLQAEPERTVAVAG